MLSATSGLWQLYQIAWKKENVFMQTKKPVFCDYFTFFFFWGKFTFRVFGQPSSIKYGITFVVYYSILTHFTCVTVAKKFIPSDCRICSWLVHYVLFIHTHTHTHADSQLRFGNKANTIEEGFLFWKSRLLYFLKSNSDQHLFHHSFFFFAVWVCIERNVFAADSHLLKRAQKGSFSVL